MPPKLRPDVLRAEYAAALKAVELTWLQYAFGGPESRPVVPQLRDIRNQRAGSSTAPPSPQRYLARPSDAQRPQASPKRGPINLPWATLLCVLGSGRKGGVLGRVRVVHLAISRLWPASVHTLQSP